VERVYNHGMSPPRTRLVSALLVALSLVACSEDNSPTEGAQQAYDLGVEALQRDDRTGAILQFRAATNISPRWGEAWRGLAYAAWTGRDHKSFIDAARALLERDPDDVEMAWLLADVALAAGMPRAATQGIDVCVRVRPRAASTELLRARLAFELGKIEKAGAHARRAVAKDKSLAEAHHIQGRSAAEAGETEKAHRSYLATLRADPGHLGAHSALSLMLLDVNNTQESAKHRRLHLAISMATERHFRSRPAEERLADFEPLTAELPGWTLGQVELGRALLEAGRLVEARKALAAALQHDGENSEVHHLMGRVMNGLGREKSAELHIQRARALGRP